MKNLYAFTMAIVLVISANMFTWAQLPNNTVETTLLPNDVYTVVEGDSLAALSPDKWKELKSFNSFLQEPGRTRERANGYVWVLIRPGEQLKGLRTLGISVENAPGKTGAQLPDEPKTDKPIVETNTEEAGLLSIIASWVPWILTTIALMIAAAAIYLVWFLLRRRNASGAGPKFVEGGLNDNTAQAEFVRQARASYGDGNRPLEWFRVTNLRRRRASGTVLVEFKNGTQQSHLLNNDIVYVADLEYPNGTIHRDQMLLSACGNPLRGSGNVLRYIPGLNFQFVDGQAQTLRVTEPEQNPQPEPQVAKPAKAGRDGIFFTEDGSGAIVDINGKTVEFSISSDMSFQLGEEKSVTVRRNWVQLKIENGRIMDFGLDGEPKKVVPTKSAEDEVKEEEAPMAESAANAS